MCNRACTSSGTSSLLVILIRIASAICLPNRRGAPVATRIIWAFECGHSTAPCVLVQIVQHKGNPRVKRDFGDWNPDDGQGWRPSEESVCRGIQGGGDLAQIGGLPGNTGTPVPVLNAGGRV